MVENKYSELISSIQPDQRTALNSILLVDGLNCFLRSFTAINHVNPEGYHIGGLTGFLKSVGYAIKMLNPTKVIIIFDGANGSSARKNLFPAYKANRNANRITNYSIFKSKDEELESIKNQVERLIQYLKCTPTTIVSIDGLEADDIIGYLSNQFEKFDETKEVNIMSADQDFLQLVTDKVSVYSPTKKKIYTPKDILNEYGINSTNFLNYKVLMGDKSDNIPGIDGLGPVKIKKLFPELLENKRILLDDIILKAADNIDSNKLYFSVVERRHQLLINEQLMNLNGHFISPDNKQLVKSAFNNSYELNTYLFHQLYVNDKLGDSIPNVEGWLQNTFGYLNSFN